MDILDCFWVTWKVEKSIKKIKILAKSNSSRVKSIIQEQNMNIEFLKKAWINELVDSLII